MFAQYEKYKPVRRKLDSMKPNKRKAYGAEHTVELALFDSAVHYLGGLKASGKAVTPKKWKTELAKLTARKDA